MCLIFSTTLKQYKGGRKMDNQPDQNNDFNLNLHVEQYSEEGDKDSRMWWSVFGCGGTTIPCATATNVTEYQCK